MLIFAYPMDIRSAYDRWSRQYDTDRNRTRDLEGVALREVLKDIIFDRVLELGCGTGKNTVWLAERAGHVTAVDLSSGMLIVVQQKVPSPTVHFVQANILQPWTFTEGLFDLVTFSLMLEHVQDLRPVLQRAAEVLRPDGRVYIGELHPFKQYMGTKARFEGEEGTRVVTCYDHHISDFVQAAKEAGLHLDDLREYSDVDGAATPPRVLALVFHK